MSAARDEILDRLADYVAASNIAAHAGTALVMGEREAPREKQRLETAKRTADRHRFNTFEFLLSAINKATR